MRRRRFLRTGLSAGLLSATGLSLSPRPARAAPHRSQDTTIRLSSNENPLGISPEARQAILGGIAEANRYPTRRSELVQALATRHGVPSENVVLGAGSTEILKMAVQAFGSPGGRLIVADPTYEDTGWYARPLAVRVERVPLTESFAHDIGAMRARAESGPGPVCVYLCNPNNPTGTLTSCDEIDEWIRLAPEHVHFLVDEAYFDYVHDPSYRSALPWVSRKPNVLVARTFSKVYGMAGIRLGYGIAHGDTANRLRDLQIRNNANHFALLAGLASLGSDTFVRRSLEVNERGKRILYQCLDDLGLTYLPSHTNFVMHRITGDLRSYIVRMREHGIRVGRPFPPMTGYNRVSIGIPDEMGRFAETLREFRHEGLI